MVRLVGAFRRFQRFGFFACALAGLWFVANASGGPGGKALRANLPSASHQTAFTPFGFLWSPQFSVYERITLFAVAGIAILALLYAAYLMGFVSRADKGTVRMQDIAKAIREGSKAYLTRQRNTLLPIIALIALLLLLTANWHTQLGASLPIGRALAFVCGALFSLTVGTVGMFLATRGNLSVAAAAADEGFGKALLLGYRTGTVTGILIDGLGLLGATFIFMYYGDRAPDVLLGFAFGGTLIALFMRVGGGIYTKAADVGADLVGKIEKDIPEDDPRNAATIADNVGDNVGDCAGMAADIFESYEVTLVAAMILGWASFGHKGVLFPLLAQAIGVISDIISTSSVRAPAKGGVKEAMHCLNSGFRFGAILCTIGFCVLGFFYLRFNTAAFTINHSLAAIEAHTPAWASMGVTGLDMRPAVAAIVGLVLAVLLNLSTEYFTGTEHGPVRGLVRACSTGHATNIIQGLATGMESSVMAILIIAGSIFTSVMIFAHTNPIFVAYGVAMCGIGMLSLTGNTISMDVFGPVADNANGIGEMGYDRQEMGEQKYQAAREVLSDLDSTGNTTKAITKGIAIGSAVIASVSLFASFITIIGSGGRSDHAPLSEAVYRGVSGLLNLSDPLLFIGLLIGGAVPFLFSAMTIRAVGRAAFLIVQTCREQFRDQEIWAGTKKPDYGKVVNICTLEAQSELIGPGILAVLTPVLVGFSLGVMALAGFLAGAILSGQLLAVFMANAGGAWDNAKKVVECEPRDEEKQTGKGSERHKASVTGDTVGDPLKDTAGPAINPLIKVMNMVSLLIVPLVLPFDRGLVHQMAATVPGFAGVQLCRQYWIAWVVSVVCALALAWAVYRSRHESPEPVAPKKVIEQ